MNRNSHLSEKNYEKHVQPHMSKNCATKKKSNSHHIASTKPFILKTTFGQNTKSIGSKIKSIFSRSEE